MNIRQISLSIVAATAISTSIAQTKVAIPSTETFNFDEVTYTPSQTTFKLFAPYGGKVFPKVKLYLYKDADSPKPYKTIKMPYPKNATGEVWSATVKGDLKGRFYTFRVNDLRLKETPGVFAKAVSING
jgi:pullulanase